MKILKFDRIKFLQLMIERGLSQRDVAKKLRTHSNYLSKICTSVHMPSMKLVNKMAKFLKVDTKDLYMEVEDGK